ncbi:GNAT family N-acetyltransferase [Pseudoduganella armeniaca]|uniref:GNAT family N-acetyltransferase n=1 Tax=Pseudoduganella armeniaca TaxID=2072590 RepID=A0A2R4C5J0_9BURK|nr:GNAT family N-acetyltransferase [Pseudoduganella armeniaca]AVR94875.1 GNAT family N-acetyltransferase [Pseudoduganella armeniaca]
MAVQVRQAAAADAAIVAALVRELTDEIVRTCDAPPFQYDAAATAALCAQWMDDGRYTVLLAFVDERPAGVVTVAESHALYAGGKIGIVQECYVAADYRSHGVGSALLEGVQALAPGRGWAALELCTPPLPQFERTLAFYQRHGLVPVGGRKMRRQY